MVYILGCAISIGAFIIGIILGMSARIVIREVGTYFVQSNGNGYVQIDNEKKFYESVNKERIIVLKTKIIDDNKS